MTTTMRSILGGAATGAGAVALLLGAAACTGDEGEHSPESQPATTSAEEQGEPTEDPGAGSGASDGGGESPFDQDQLDAASQRFVDLLKELDDQDWDAACGMVLDPTTGTAPEGERLQECADGVEPLLGERAETLEPGAFDAIDASMIEASDNGDGTVSLSVLGDELGIPMAPGDDSRWYLVIPF